MLGISPNDAKLGGGKPGAREGHILHLESYCVVTITTSLQENSRAPKRLGRKNAEKIRQ